MKKTKTLSGFTLLELMITLAVAGIVTMIGIPSFQNLINNSRLTAYANDLHSALSYARSEAVSRNTDVIITKIGGAVDDGVWDGGWKIEAGAELLKQHEAMPNGFTLRTGDLFENAIIYTSDGFSRGGAGGLGNDKFTLCDANADTAFSREIIINKIGRARIKKGEGVC